MMQELAELNFVSFTTAGKAHLWAVNTKSYTYKALSQLLGQFSQENTAVIADLKNIILATLPKRLLEKIVLFDSIIKRNRTN